MYVSLRYPLPRTKVSPTQTPQHPPIPSSVTSPPPLLVNLLSRSSSMHAFLSAGLLAGGPPKTACIEEEKHRVMVNNDLLTLPAVGSSAEFPGRTAAVVGRMSVRASFLLKETA
ncbi:hypothetical protein MRX96_004937 [Rhipicephalus microplus]